MCRPSGPGSGIPGLIDIHTHFMPAAARARCGLTSTPPGHAGRPWPIHYRLGRRAGRALRTLGVRRFSALAYPHKPGMAALINDWTLGFAETPERCARQPSTPSEAATYVPRLDRRRRQVFKVPRAGGGLRPERPAARPVWGALAEAGTPVVLTRAPVRRRGLHRPRRGRRGDGAPPGCALVIAHLGMPEIAEFLDLADSTSACGSTRRWPSSTSGGAAARRGAAAPGGPADRVLFGTDFPNIPYDTPTSSRCCERLGLGDDWMRSVCGTTAPQLFGVAP